MNSPRVSVLMTAYNSAAYLEEAVASVLAQTMADLELIVVDDGSSDETPAILARLAARDPRIVAHRQANQGIGGATNTALALARAEYVAILDSDDAMEPERLAIQADYLDRHPETAAVGSQWYTMDVDSRINGIDRHPTAPDAVKNFMFAYFSMHHPTITARKAAILAGGGYDAIKPQGCRDYEVFSNLLLAGYALANLPMLLTRWRLNPAGVTHSKARPQTEDCVDIRTHFFTRFSLQHPEAVADIAKTLVRTFPEGSWFDEKIAGLIPDAEPSPALSRWRTSADLGELPALDVLAVDWLNDESRHADALAQELEHATLPWLAELVRAKTGGDMPRPMRLGMSTSKTGAPTCSLSVLIPARADDDDLPERIGATLSSLPDDVEVLVFSTDASEIQTREYPTDARLRFLPNPPAPGNAWLEAATAAQGRLIAWLETGQRHHPDFLAQARAWLDAHPDDVMAYAPSDLFYRDAMDALGRPVKNPAPSPRWSQETLLGQDRARLGMMVHRREALSQLPLDLQQTGEMTGWALARYLLTRYRPALLDLRNIEFAPAINPGNNILATLTRRLVRWYLDTGLGSVPASHTWHDMAPGEVRKRLRTLGMALSAGELCLYHGNTPELLRFSARFSALPAMNGTFRAILARNRRAALGALREYRPLQLPFALAWWAAHKLRCKLSG